MNNYMGDTRYEKVWEQMQLLGIEDVTSKRQAKNGTRVWKLPIKNYWPGNKENATYIEVASFSTGYVRNQNSGYTNYQLNKRCQGEPEYFELPNGDYRKYVGKTRIKIPVEIDRLEYLISYCLKNYYIKNANTVPNGDYVPKWKLDNAINACNKMEQRADDFENEKLKNKIGWRYGNDDEISVTINGHRYKVK